LLNGRGQNAAQRVCIPGEVTYRDRLPAEIK